MALYIMQITHKKRLSVYGKCIARFRKSQGTGRNSYTGHKLLKGNFDPDIRPFEWPERVKVIQRRIKQLDMFEEDL